MKSPFRKASLLLALSSCLYAVDNLQLRDVRTLSLGNNGVVNSVYFNPALLTHSNRNLTVFYYNQYGIKELNTLSAGFTYPNSFFPVAVYISSFGYEEYRENNVRLLTAKDLNEKWSLGIGVQYTFLQTLLFDNKIGMISTDVGITYSSVDNLLIGLLITDFPSIKVKNKSIDTKQFNSYSLQIGINWQIINSTFISIGADYSKFNPFNGKVGLEYIYESFSFRSGIQTKPFIPSLGIGYSFTSFFVDMTLLNHTVLGTSMGIGIGYNF